MRARLASIPVTIALLAGANFPLAGPPAAFAVPAATDDTTYEAYGRVFPDPHGCMRGLPGKSPWAKGKVCAAQFIQWDEALAGLKYLQQRFPRYLELINLHDVLSKNPAFSGEDFQSAGLAREDLTRDRRDLYVVKVTDRESPVAEAKRKRFAYSLSIHGIERAGLEGGLRAAEDLVTWAVCEHNAEAGPACASEGPFPKPLLEPTESGPTAGKVLAGSVVYFILSNPDGWHRGEATKGGVFFERYNGNGMDVNRDWPSVGYTEPLYTPWSEPESRGYGKFLLGEKARSAEGRFAGAIDLHGMLSSHAFSFTLLGAGQRDYRKNAVTVDTAIRTFRDSEKRLSWSPLVAPRDRCPGPIPEPYFGRTWIPMCSDQWGTVWDTIDYQITGGFGDWSDSPLGLDAVGIDNEMAMSHIAPDDYFDPDFEQLHIDGNKGLIYSQIASLLEEKPVIFRPSGRIAYLFDPARVRSATKPALNPIAGRPPQAAIEHMDSDGIEEFRFEVKGPSAGVYNGGLTVEATYSNVRGLSPQSAAGSLVLDYCGGAGHAGDPPSCREVARYFNQSPLYLQSGARIDLNEPSPGPYRLRVEDGAEVPASYRISFSRGRSFETPEQAPYDVSRMDFFTELNRFVPPSLALKAVTVPQITADATVLNAYDTLVAAGGAAEATALSTVLRAFVAAGGNLVLTDGALAALPSIVPAIKASDVTRGFFYGGWIDFDDGNGATYGHPLARGVDMEGTAEGHTTIDGQSFVHRHQTYEPVPLGYYMSQTGSENSICEVDRCDSPTWIVDTAAWKAAGGATAGRTLVDLAAEPVENQQRVTGTSLGELKIGKGSVRIVGALLPDPTKANYHPFGLASYALTYTGYQLFENAVSYTRPGGARPSTVLGERRRREGLPATGVETGLPVPAALLGVAAAISLRLRRRR